MTTLTHLTTEYRSNPTGIDIVQPRFAWKLKTDRAGARQTSFHLLAASRPDLLHEGKADLWDSGRIESDQSVHVRYAGAPLTSRQQVYWKVTVWDEAGNAAESETAQFEMGLLHRSDWKAQWIGSTFSAGPRSMLPVPYLRKSFTLPAGVTSARLYITALGLYECSINGLLASDDVFAPGWTEYGKRVQYCTYDVADLLQQGENVIGVMLGDGWAAGYIGWLHRQVYVDRPRVLAQLEITLADGSQQVITSDESWTHQFGAITHSDFLQGEAYDARKEMPGWDTPGFNASKWLPVETFQHDSIALSAMNGPTVRRIEELQPIREPATKGLKSRKRDLFDMGQNMVGRVRFRGSAPAGTTITFRFAEVLNADGSMYTDNMRSADATDYYTFRGEGEEVWEPRFTFHGFRYVEIAGYPGDATRETVTGIVLHSDIPQTGTFECSDPLLNQLQRNILWGQRGNFVDLPTDCPQRDERLGWTGDIQVFVRTAAFNMDVASFMTRWLRDVGDAQNPDGSVPAVVPFAAEVPSDGGPAWADAVVICPWTIYLCYGDTGILESNYATMAHFMDFLVANSPGLIRCAPDFEGWPGFGDWLSINADTPRDLIGTAFLAHDANLMSKIATVLGRHDDAAKYQKLFEDTKAAFGARYLADSPVPLVEFKSSAIREEMDNADRISRGNLKFVDYGPVTSEVFNTELFTPTQTAYLLGLHFDLLPERLHRAAVRELVADLERRGMHLSAGFVGSSYLNPVLSAHGRTDVAYDLLHQKTWPSWLYAVTQGATTIWERWDGWTPENGFQTPEMNSFNHYAYGAIGAWLYGTTAGIEIDPARPGYKHILLRPVPGGGLTYARASLETLYGELLSEWEILDGVFYYDVIVPPNTTATITVPEMGNTVSLNGQVVSGHVHHVSAGRHHLEVQ